MDASAPFDPSRETQRILEALEQSSHDAIIATRLDGVVLSWSRGAERVYGYPAAAMLGQSILRIIPKDRSREFTSVSDRIAAGEAIENLDTVRQTQDGRLLDIVLNVSPIRGDDARVIGALVVARDVTAQKRAEAALDASERRWRAVVDSAVDAMIVITARGAIEVFNPAAERLFGFSEQEVLGRNINMLMPSPYREEHDRYLDHYLQTGQQKIIGIGREVTGRRRDGTTFPVHLAVGELRIGSERHFTGILHDLSPRVELEERMREQTTLARLGEMAAVIAHEVKNPLAAVKGAIEVIGGRLPAGSRDVPIIREIINRIDALDELIKDLLLFARTPQPKLASVDMGSLLHLTADLLAGDPALGRLVVEIDGVSPPIQGDAELLKIAFQNLFINAAQAMQGNGRLTVSLTAADGVLTIRVRDQGPGIPQEARANLFRPFFTTKSRGTGLGLPTARRLIELHAGTIAVECPPGGGTLVTVALPLEAAS
jgi:two-component system sensor kinase FixL